MFLMFTLRRPDVLPTALRRADGNQEALQETQIAEPEQMKKIAKCWEPHRSVACWYLWRSLDIKTI